VRFLADESCDFVVVRALRVGGHDVAAIAEMSPRATDEVVLELAIRESRILLTEDKDFGQLLHANEAAAGGATSVVSGLRHRLTGSEQGAILSP
jgi:predicted nuclease of predicted toxin-antitoxin system